MIILQLNQEELKELISGAVNEALSKIDKTKSAPQVDQWLTLEQLCEYRPEKPAKATVYAEVSKGLIPVHKKSKRLIFLKSEIDAWIKNGRKKTTAELIDEADKEFVENIKKRHP
jgi:hypothetical protein